jgi:integrase
VTGRQLAIAGANLAIVVPRRREALDALVRAALERSNEPYPPNTRRAYEQAWERWGDWCDRRELASYTPVPPTELLGMLEEMAQQGLSVSTVELTLSGISSVDTWLRTVAGAEPEPVRSDARVRRWMKQFRRSRAEDPVRQQPALLRPDLVHVLAEIARPQPAVGLTADQVTWLARRDHALIVMGWLGAFRCEVIGRLRVSDVRVEPGGLELVVRKAKNRQTGQPRTSYLYAQSVPELCPRVQWLAWHALRTQGGALELDPEAPAFPTRTGRRMAPGDVSQAVARRCIAAGVPGYTGHSLRSGLATWAKLIGKAESDIKQHGDWASETVQRYFRRATARDGNPTQGLF